MTHVIREQRALVRAFISSLERSCKQYCADPEAYIEDVLAAISTTPSRRIVELTPWGWAPLRQLASQS